MSSSAAKRGALIVFEGVDRCGKSTQTKMLAEALPNAKLMRFPDRTTATGKIVDAYLKIFELDDKAVHLLFSANGWRLPRVCVTPCMKYDSSRRSLLVFGRVLHRCKRWSGYRVVQAARARVASARRCHLSRFAHREGDGAGCVW